MQEATPELMQRVIQQSMLQNKEMLLVLDNFEHVTAGQSQLLGQILAACPDVKMLVTSWEPLNLAAEWRYDLAGLAYPRTNHDDLESFGAVQLFAQTARQARASFQLSPENRHYVAALCQLVGGMPLAIKLAAAWLRMMQVQEVQSKLSNVSSSSSSSNTNNAHAAAAVAGRSSNSNRRGVVQRSLLLQPALSSIAAKGHSFTRGQQQQAQQQQHMCMRRWMVAAYSSRPLAAS